MRGGHAKQLSNLSSEEDKYGHEEKNIFHSSLSSENSTFVDALSSKIRDIGIMSPQTFNDKKLSEDKRKKIITRKRHRVQKQKVNPSHFNSNGFPQNNVDHIRDEDKRFWTSRMLLSTFIKTSKSKKSFKRSKKPKKSKKI